jgi:hypothetical protein
VDLQIHTLYLAATILLWIAVYYAAYWLVALARDPALVCMSVGPLGVSVISLREPPRGRLLAQLACAAVAVAGAAYVSLFLVVPPPIGGLSRSLSTRLVAVCIPVLVISGTRLLGILRDRRYPLWGEARMLTGVQRGLATGARIYFTATGRAYLRERFGATPREFLSMVRR